MGAIHCTAKHKKTYSGFLGPRGIAIIRLVAPARPFQTKGKANCAM
ncbi:hypothetical protein AGROH133_06397 [Agrobacterium tumefaciens]|nr:hypothetical protein AGROH133_06397 [Agrobacterium tumefaciens]